MKKNYSRAFHPHGHVAIAVATGNEATGTLSSPSTKSVKGPSTVDAVEVNRLQAWLPGMEPSILSNEQEKDNQEITWLLLIHHAANEIRSELSHPVDIGADGRVSVWRERILLQSLPLDPSFSDVRPPVQPDIEVQVVRKK